MSAALRLSLTPVPARPAWRSDGAAVSQNTYLGVDITPAPDYIKIAEAFDACGERVTKPEEIEPTLNRALGKIAEDKTVLLDVIPK